MRELTDLRKAILKVADQQAKAINGGGWGHAVWCNYQRLALPPCNCGLADLQQLARKIRKAEAERSVELCGVCGEEHIGEECDEET